MVFPLLHDCSCIIAAFVPSTLGHDNSLIGHVYLFNTHEIKLRRYGELR